MQTGQEAAPSGEDRLPLLSSLVITENHASKVGFGSKTHVPEPYKPTQSQALVEGRKGILRQLDFQARLLKVEFGQISKHPACLIIFYADFPKGPYIAEKERFTSTNVTAEFKLTDNSPVNSEILVHDFYPKVILGHIQPRSMASTTQLQFPNTPFGGGGPAYTYSSTQQIQSQHTIHGRKVGVLENKVKWAVNENANSRSGLYLTPKFAVTIKYAAGHDFQLDVDIHATTSLMSPTVMKHRYPITFSPQGNGTHSSDTETVHSTPMIQGGSLGVPGEKMGPIDIVVITSRFESDLRRI